jgi:Putative MetA-pathway of phenol degradation
MRRSNAAVGPFGFARENSVTGFGDPIPQASLRWNDGVHNYMTYVTGNIPVGAYDSRRLANLGIGHGAVDAGGRYTYFNPQTGQEFTAVLGFTYNFQNQSTQYADRLQLSARRVAGLYQSQGLQGVQRRAPSGWLEHVAHILDLAGSAERHTAAAAADGHEVAERLDRVHESRHARA